MRAFDEYLNRQIQDHLKSRRVVVWYDPNAEFSPYIEQLPASGEKVQIGEAQATFARYKGSFFAVREAVEPLVSADFPDPVLIYIPGVPRDPHGSVLMEMEKAGMTYEPQLKRLARNALRQYYTDGVIDGMLAAEKVSYEDVVTLLERRDGEPGSILKVVFPKAGDNAGLLANWLAEPTADKTILEKGGQEELLKLVQSRLGLELPLDTDLPAARDHVVRYVLLGEFRSDLAGEAPQSLSMIPRPATDEQTRFSGETAAALRQRYPDAYIALADKVESQFRLAGQTIAADQLGKVDTFRFEERAVLAHVGNLICERRFDEAQEIAATHKRSFWADRDMRRQQQWHVVQVMAQLGQAAQVVRKELPGQDSLLSEWIKAYTAEGGWYRVDRLHRSLESLAAAMSQEPDSEQGLRQVRDDYEQLLGDMAKGFLRSIQRSDWDLPETLRQTRVYSALIEGKTAPIALFLVDSMRYEMGVELRDLLAEAEDLSLRPALAALPTVTPIGMAALMPGAAASFSVVGDGGKLAALVDGSVVSDLPGRLKCMKGRVPGLVDIELDRVLQLPKSHLAKRIEGAPLVLVRSQDIDEIGETGGTNLARQAMDIALQNVARAIRKLADQGVERFVIAADHGHLFASPKDPSMRIDSPGGDTVAIHRRCWVGRGGSTPPGTVRVSGHELEYDCDLDFVFPAGLGVFKAGGDLAYHHGGVSLQEMLIPVITLRMPSRSVGKPVEVDVELFGLPEAVTNRAFSIGIVQSGKLFEAERLEVRPVLLSGNVQVGRAAMAIEATVDPRTHCVGLEQGKKAMVGMILDRDDCDRVRVVIQDPATDAVLAQSADLPVRLLR
jgi:hypothetical protein